MRHPSIVVLSCLVAGPTPPVAWFASTAACWGPYPCLPVSISMPDRLAPAAESRPHFVIRTIRSLYPCISLDVDFAMTASAQSTTVSKFAGLEATALVTSGRGPRHHTWSQLKLQDASGVSFVPSFDPPTIQLRLSVVGRSAEHVTTPHVFCLRPDTFEKAFGL